MEIGPITSISGHIGHGISRSFHKSWFFLQLSGPSTGMSQHLHGLNLLMASTLLKHLDSGLSLSRIFSCFGSLLLVQVDLLVKSGALVNGSQLFIWWSYMEFQSLLHKHNCTLLTLSCRQMTGNLFFGTHAYSSSATPSVSLTMVWSTHSSPGIHQASLSLLSPLVLLSGPTGTTAIAPGLKETWREEANSEIYQTHTVCCK